MDRPDAELPRGLNPGLAWLFRVVPYYHRWFRFYQFWTSVEGRRDFAAVDPAWHEPGSVSAKNHALRETLTRHLMAEYEGRPDLQRVMIPRHPPYGKRMLRDNGVWARALKQPNVTVVSDRIERITPAGIVTADGTEHPLDVIVYCTGFHAWRFLGGIDVTGTRGSGPAPAVGPGPGRLPGHHRSRLPEPLLPLRAEHQPRRQRQHRHVQRVRGALRDGVPAGAARAR